MPESFDVIVVGAGPAGSTSAYFLAREGLSVLLLDRARFPRDKPCGGGVTGRAAALLPFSIEPVVEDVVHRLEIGLSYARRFERQSEKPLIYMTRRVALDAFLVEKAREAGAVFRDATKVTEVELRADDVLVKTKDWTGTCRVVIGADGTNGITARSLGCDARPDAPRRARGRPELRRGRSRSLPGASGARAGGGSRRLRLDLPEGRPRQRRRRRLGDRRPAPSLPSRPGSSRATGSTATALENVRGYRLPLRGAGDGLTNGRGLVVGDAAGLVDPLTGDGMYEAFLSARLASRTVVDFLRGRTDELAPYAEATLRAIGPLCVASWGGKRAFDRFPRLSYSVARTRRAWRVIADLLQDGASRDALPDSRPDAAVSQRAPGRNRRRCRPAVPAGAQESASLTAVPA